jgi:hypothetical protein
MASRDNTDMGVREQNGNGLTAWPSGPAGIVLAHDRRHLIQASHARLERGFVVAIVKGEWRAWSSAEVASVRWSAGHES